MKIFVYTLRSSTCYFLQLLYIRIPKLHADFDAKIKLAPTLRLMCIGDLNRWSLVKSKPLGDCC